MNQSELKPCPFCGGEAMAWDYSTESDTWQVTCHSKDPDCVVTVYSSDSQDAAIAAWNKRVEPAATPVTMPDDVLNAIEELDNLAGEAIPYAGEYFDDKWALSERYDAAHATVYAWLERQRGAEGG